MKRWIVLSVLAVLALGAWADDYLAPVQVPAIGFKAELRDGKVVCTWKEYLRGDLMFYKVVRSKENPNPVYPDDGYIFYTEDPKATSYADEGYRAGVWYYSLTIVTQNGARWTAAPVKLTLGEPKPVPPGAADFR